MKAEDEAEQLGRGLTEAHGAIRDGDGLTPSVDLSPVLTDPWTAVITERCVLLAEQAEEKSARHMRDAAYCRTNATLLSVPALIIPVIFAPLVLLLGGQSCSGHGTKAADYVASIGFVSTGMIQAITRHYQFDERRVHHARFASHYTALSSEIREELARDRHFRQNADTFLTSLRIRLANYVEHEPMHETL